MLKYLVPWPTKQYISTLESYFFIIIIIIIIYNLEGFIPNYFLLYKICLWSIQKPRSLWFFFFKCRPSQCSKWSGNLESCSKHTKQLAWLDSSCPREKWGREKRRLHTGRNGNRQWEHTEANFCVLHGSAQFRPCCLKDAYHICPLTEVRNSPTAYKRTHEHALGHVFKEIYRFLYTEEFKCRT